MTGTTSAHVRWETSLFAVQPGECAPVAADRVSPRAAYQDALWGRAVLVDLRPSRLREAVIHPDLRPREAAQIDNWSTPIILVGCSEAEVAPVAAALTKHGAGQVAVLAGGFAQWLAAGLPVRRTRRAG